MAHRQLLFRSEAREKILRGATALADAVRVTLGPKSKCVLIERKWGSPIVCNARRLTASSGRSSGRRSSPAASPASRDLTDTSPKAASITRSSARWRRTSRG